MVPRPQSVAGGSTVPDIGSYNSYTITDQFTELYYNYPFILAKER